MGEGREQARLIPDNEVNLTDQRLAALGITLGPERIEVFEAEGREATPEECHRCCAPPTFSAYVASLGLMFACDLHADHGKAWPGWNPLPKEAPDA